MGKVCLILAAMMLALLVFPKNQVNGASLETPLIRGRSEVDGGGLDYGDYAFLNRPEPSFGGFGGGFPKRLSMKRHGRLMKRLRRYAYADKSIPANKIPAGCCSCGDHYCCDGMCHGKR